MDQGSLIMLIGASILLLVPAVPDIIGAIRQLIALKKGRPYRSDCCFDRHNGMLRVKWTDNEGIQYDRVFRLRPHLDLMYYPRHSNITEITVYSYKNMASLGKTSVLGDLSMFFIWIAGIIFLWIYVIIKYN